MEMKNIPSAGANITEEEVKLVTEAVKYGWYENRNMHLTPFVKEFAKYAGTEYVLPVSSCTAAIHLALLGLGIGKGDEVIVPDMTWVASAAPIHYVGATPVFADIDEKSWCLSPQSFEKSITPRTKAVIVVDLYGNMPNWDEILKIAQKHNIKIIEDAAESIGAKYKGKNAGTFGDVNVFSFNATKITIAGQGGVLTTNNEAVFERAKKLAHHGMVKYTNKTTFWSEEIGYNYQWTNIQAALALAQFRRVDELVNQRRQIFNWYRERLKDIDGVVLNSEADNVYNTYWVVTAIVDPKYGIKKDEFLRRFTAKNIDTRPFFYPISSMPAYEQYVNGRNMKEITPISYELSGYGISFPSYGRITKGIVDRVCEEFIGFLSK